MTIKSLEYVSFNQLMDCFLKAFENYFVKMPTDHEFYRERWKRAKVRYDLSFGMFHEEKLVGFIINAVDHRNNEFIAFNTGTGVIPAYRGQRIVQKLYDFAFPILKAAGITLCSLEVITKNKKAIKAYEGVGFHITKTLKCYGGKLSLINNGEIIELKKVSASYFDWKALEQHHYSWDNHIKSVGIGGYEFYVVQSNNENKAYFIINPVNGYIAQFDVFEEGEHNWHLLFLAIQSVSDTIKINNVDARLTTKVDFLNKIGLKNTVDQYEMELKDSILLHS